MFDPERVVISGAIAAGADQIVAAARRALPTGLDLPAPELVVSRLGADVVVTGAVMAACAAARENALDIWASSMAGRRGAQHTRGQVSRRPAREHA